MAIPDDVGTGGTPQDSEEVAALKARIAELEERKADTGGHIGTAEEHAAATGDLPPADPSGTLGTPGGSDTGTGDEPSPEVQALQEQLKAKQAEIDDLTNKALAQKDPATADASVDVKALLNQLVQAQSDYRSEITQLRTELAKVRRTPIPTSTVRPLSAEELLAVRMAQIAEASHYCPACGALYNRPRECTGPPDNPASPHPAVEVVSTGELRDPPDSSDKAAVEEYQAGHTHMQYVNPHVQDALLG